MENSHSTSPTEDGKLRLKKEEILKDHTTKAAGEVVDVVAVPC